MDIVFSLILVLGAVFGVFLLVKGGRQSNKKLAVFGGIIAGVCALFFLLKSYGCSSGGGDIKKAERIEQVACKYAGMQLKGKNVMVIFDDALRPGEKKIQDMMYEAFKEGYGGTPSAEYRIAYLQTYGMSQEEAWEKTEKYYGDFRDAYSTADSNNYDVIVHFTGIPFLNAVPEDINLSYPSSAKILLMPSSLKLESYSARRFAEYLFEHNHLYGIITEKKGFKHNDEIPDDVVAAFEKCYLLITPENKDSYPEYLEYSATE